MSHMHTVHFPPREAQGQDPSKIHAKAPKKGASKRNGRETTGTTTRDGTPGPPASMQQGPPLHNWVAWEGGAYRLVVGRFTRVWEELVRDALGNPAWLQISTWSPLSNRNVAIPSSVLEELLQHHPEVHLLTEPKEPLE